MPQTLPRRIFVILFFAIIGLAADRINITAIWGADGQSFTALQLFAPAVGAFLGGVSGMITIGLTEIASFLFQGKELTILNMMRLLPLLFATLYFASIVGPLKRGSRVIEVGIPLLAMLTFWAHPIGREVWYYTFYWLIPMGISLTPLRKYLVGRALGSTFTAHAIGGAYWIWLTNMPAALWIAVIPVVAIERITFGLGIAVTYAVVNSLLSVLPVIRALPILLDSRYQFFPLRIFK